MACMRYLRLSVFFVFTPSVSPQNTLVDTTNDSRFQPRSAIASPMICSDLPPP